jgi:hypothetical protein
VPVGPAATVELPMVKYALLVELKNEAVLKDPTAVGPTIVLFPAVGKGALLLVSMIAVVETLVSEGATVVVLPQPKDALMEVVEVADVLVDGKLAETVEDPTTEGPLVATVLLPESKGADAEEVLTTVALVISGAEVAIELELTVLLNTALAEVAGAEELETVEVDGTVLLSEAEALLLKDATLDVVLTSADVGEYSAEEDV